MLKNTSEENKQKLKELEWWSKIFGEIVIEKHKFHYSKNQIWIDDVDTDKMLISNRICFGEKDSKYFVGYEDN